MIQNDTGSQWPDQSSSSPRREGDKRGGSRFEPQKIDGPLSDNAEESEWSRATISNSGSATDNAEENVWWTTTNHSTPCPHPWVQHRREGREAEIWGAGRLHHHAECGAQRRPRHWMTRLWRPRRLEGVRDGGGRVRLRVGGSWGP